MITSAHIGRPAGAAGKNTQKMFLFVSVLCAVSIQTACLINEKCYRDKDCDPPKVCNRENGRCIYECMSSEECDEGFFCENRLCVPEEVENIECPDDMVAVADSFCIDRYEASRPDATPSFEGLDRSCAVSLEGVIPWHAESNEIAEEACRAAGKRLCTPMEWELACSGPDETVYAYGDTYEPETCNGLDTFGRQYFHLTPTGYFPGCTNEWGIYDMNGNLWERVAGGDGMAVRGGAYNCIDSETLHRCDYIPGNWTPTALGFRCCLTPESHDDT